MKRYDYAIIGLGMTGYSCVDYLVSGGAEVIVFDSRDNPPFYERCQEKYPDIAVYCGDIDPQLLLQAREIVVSPGVAVESLGLTQDQLQQVSIVGDIELFARAAQAPIIAITGSNGKSTVTTLVAEIATAAGYAVEVGGNIGTAALDLLQRPCPDYYILELSSFQLDSTSSLAAYAAVVLNVSPDHMDRYAGFNAYEQSKLTIYNNCKHAIIHLDESYVKQNHHLSFVNDNTADVITCSVDACCDQAYFSIKSPDKQDGLYRHNKMIMLLEDCSHHLRNQPQNCLSALALAEVMAIDVKVTTGVLSKFQGLPHRCRWVCDIRGVSYYNDSKATNTAAAAMALRTLGQRCQNKLIWLVGGIAKDADISCLVPLVKKYIGHMIVFGQDKHIFIEAFNNLVSIHQVESMKQAVFCAHDVAEMGDYVLLAPACASFDMFDNFEHRGNVFESDIRALADTL